MTIYFLDGSKLGSAQLYNLNGTNFGPFSYTNLTQLKDFMREVDSIDVEYNIKNLLPLIAISESNCYDWTIKQRYDFHFKSSVRLSINFFKTSCSSSG